MSTGRSHTAAADLAASHGLGHDAYRELATRMRSALSAEVAEIVEEAQSPDGAIPEIDFADLADRRAGGRVRERIVRRGCVIVRGVFDRELVAEWECEIGEYLTANGFRERYEERYGEAAANASGIIGIYWSRPQIAARQHDHMVAVRRFLNDLWHDGSSGGAGFVPDRDIGYPDRLRRRAPGAPARGLRPHIDAASSRGWRLAENQFVFRSVLAGRPDKYDPWDVAGRTGVDAAVGAPSSVFRTFQGWTALSRMQPADGGLQLLPVPTAVALSIVAGLAADLDETPGVPSPSTGSRPRTVLDELLRPALVPIPAVEPGDTVWWHGDLFHSVAPAANRERWSNVMYIGAAPACPRNEAYGATMYERFASGTSPVDFPAEDFEADFVGRAGVADLNDAGRRWFGLGPLVHT